MSDSDVKVLDAHDVGNDVLLVRGTVAGVHTLGKDGEPTKKLQVFEAVGWVSALEQHYPPEAYDDDGNLKLKRGSKHTRAGAKDAEAPATDPEHEPRAMTEAERVDYCRALIANVAGASRPRDLGISG